MLGIAYQVRRVRDIGGRLLVGSGLWKEFSGFGLGMFGAMAGGEPKYKAWSIRLLSGWSLLSMCEVSVFSYLRVPVGFCSSFSCLIPPGFRFSAYGAVGLHSAFCFWI
jgi:hypothetical protein